MVANTSSTTDHLPLQIARVPYAPSWIDVLTGWVERLPGPAWAYYIGLYLCLIGLDLAQRAQIDAFQIPRIFVWVFLWALPYNMWFIHYTDKFAARALERFRPGLNCDDATYEELNYRLTTMPALPTLFAGLLGGLLGVGLLSVLPRDQQLALVDLSPMTETVGLYQALAVAAMALAAAVLYHTWHQLRIVSHIYRHHTAVDLFNQQPLYAFSDLSARTALGLLIISYGWSLAAPEVQDSPAAVLVLIAFNLICALTFIFPLAGIHNLLKQHKDACLATIGARFQSAAVLLHHRVDSRQVTDMDNLNKTLMALELEHKIVQRAPTWPWNPEAPRLIVGALLLPIALWLLQTLLERLLSG
jgi:hypothetical protein